MTRSSQKTLSRREAFIKSVRAKAHSEGILFIDALAEMDISPSMKDTYIHRVEHHDPGRRWHNSSVVKVDDGDTTIRDEDVYDFKIDFMDTRITPSRNADLTVSLLDIARPAKRRGPAKDFEVVQKVREVIALEDEPWDLDDEWEAIYDEQRTDIQRSYSSVLRGNER